MQNQLQLTDKQSKLISETDKVGDLTPIAFAKNIPNQDKIRFLVKEDVGPALGQIFQNLTLLLGIKEPISEINKADIKKMILRHYNNLSLEQIVYAFELERYGKLGKKTDHFQLVNAEYVAAIIQKYKTWLADVRYNNNIPLATKKIKQPEISEQEKLEIMNQGCIRCYNEFKESGRIKEGNTHIYNHLIKDLKVHKFSTEEINAARSIAERELKEESKTFNRLKAAEIIRNLKQQDSAMVNNRIKALLLANYFNSLGPKGIESILKK